MTDHEPPVDGLLYVHVKKFTDSVANSTSVNETVTPDIEQANAITSMVAENVTRHKILLDLDMPAKLIPSSTPGHFHLYIEHEMDKDAYFELLDALAKAGVIEKGYLGASETRGYTALRLPWVQKTEEEREISEKKKAAQAAADAVNPWAP